MTGLGIIEKATSIEVLESVRGIIKARKSSRRLASKMTPLFKKIVAEHIKKNTNELDLGRYFYEIIEIEMEMNKQFNFIAKEGYDFIENHASILMVIDIIYATAIAQIHESGAGVSFDDAFKKIFAGMERLKITDFLARLQGIIFDELDSVKTEIQLAEVFSRAVILENKKISLLMSAE
jgi:hypothetical protein